MELSKKIINESKSRYDVLMKVFGYANKRAYQKLNDYIKNNNINTDHWIKEDKFCINCGEILNNRRKKFCNSSCAAKYNNKKRGKRSDKTKRKISESLSKTKRNVSNSTIKRKIHYKNCLVCGKKFEVKRMKNGVLSKSKTCSNECHINLKIIRGKESANKIISEGRHKGWKTRNIISYPEKFFIKVLNNNNINYKHNYPVKQSDLGLNSHYNYFLDFYLPEKNVDLEIDGKQHHKRKESDKIRDEYLTENDYHIYRIKWKNINTKKGKLYIEEEINKFIKYYENI